MKQVETTGLPILIGALEVNAGEIDQTFAKAGSELGEGLSLFEALKERLGQLSLELSGERLSQAGESLAALARTLRGIEAGLAREALALQDLSVHSQAATQLLGGLLGHMRLITILARSARIEAVSVKAIGQDYGEFTREIVELTLEAARTIELSLRDYRQLVSLLGTALSAQRDFESRYGRALASLADELGEALAELAQRQQRGVALTRDAAAHSGKIAMAAGGAIIAMQAGDSIRQRLEHSIAALRLSAALGSGAETAGLDGPGVAAATQLLHRLQAAQLRESAATLGSNADEIEAALAVLAGDTGHLLDLVGALYRGGGRSDESFMDGLELKLAQAAELLAGCDSARAVVDRVSRTLETVLETCRGTVTALTASVSTIELIGTNAGLRAARVGMEGRSLVVIAQELKAAADLIARDARGLAPLFSAMEQAAADLEQGALDSSRFSAMNGTMQEALRAMKDDGERLAGALALLVRDGEGFDVVVARARLSFSNAAAMGDQITAAADELARLAAGPPTMPEALAPALAALMQSRIWPNYTMMAERSVHQAVLRDNCVMEQAGPASAEPEPAATDEADDFLF